MTCFPHHAYSFHEITAYILTTLLSATQFPGASSYFKYKAKGLLLHQLHLHWQHNDFSLASHTLIQVIFEELGTPGMYVLFDPLKLKHCDKKNFGFFSFIYIRGLGMRN